MCGLGVSATGTTAPSGVAVIGSRQVGKGRMSTHRGLLDGFVKLPLGLINSDTAPHR